MIVVTIPVKANVSCPLEGKIAMFITVFLPLPGQGSRCSEIFLTWLMT